MRHCRRFCTILFVFLTAIFLNISVHSLSLHAQVSDDSITVVQAFTFADDPTLPNWGNIFEYDKMIDFPAPGARYEKVLLYYTLKCDGRTKADALGCGEWDYSTWIRVWDDAENHWEIGRFITPYGINLDLGPEGFTWVFDVTDYAPILQGKKRVTAGNSQELLDMKFVFVKGVPPRDPLSVTRLWNGGSPSYQRIVDDSDLAPIPVALNPAASMYRINTRPQGGNFNGGPNTDNCGEFCDREHWLRINDTERFRWNVWKKCGDNPVYPQGGTWVFDRAGWCPGAIVNTQHHELTPFVTPGETITVDYGIENPPQFVPYGHWVFWADLVAYGPPNFTLDASLDAIVAPSTVGLYNRLNPVCSSPVVHIRNTGSTPLTKLDIEYGIEGRTPMVYVWTGSLAFLEETDVELPPMPLTDWESGGTKFTARIKNPNGGTDEYANNNYAESQVTLPPVHPRQFQIKLKTNKQAAEQYEWELRTFDGTVINSGKNLNDDTEYLYPLDLPDGCYTFELINKEGFGLDFFAVRDQLGTGSLQFALGSAVLKTFSPDFGNRVYYQFRVGQLPTMSKSVDTIDFGRVAPGQEVVKSVAIAAGNVKGLEVRQALLLAGGSAYAIESITPDPAAGLVTLGEGDTIKINVRFKPGSERTFSSRIVIQTNDFRGATQYIYLNGIGDASADVGDEPVAGESKLSVTVVPSTVTDHATVLFNTQASRKEQTTLKLVDVNGRVIRTLFNESATSGEHRVEVDTGGLTSGTYYVVLLSNGKVAAEEMKVVR